MTQPWSKEIDDELQPGMARLFASDNSESNVNQTLDSDKNESEKINYGNSVNHQGSKRTQSKPIFNVSNHINSKQEKLQKNPSSLNNSLNFNPKIQSNRALSSMLRKIQSRQNEPQYQNKFSNDFIQNPSQLSNMQGISNQISSGFHPNQDISEYSNSQQSYYPKSQFKYQINYFENSNQPGSRTQNNLRNSSFQGKAETPTNNLNQQISNSSKVNFQKSNYTGKYPIPPPPKLPPEGGENPPFLSFGSDKGINPYQIDHKNPYDSSLTNALSESISGDKRFSSKDETRENNYSNGSFKNIRMNEHDRFQNNQMNAQNRNQNPNIYQKTRMDQVNQLNQLKRVNLRNQATSLFSNTQNQKSLNRDPRYFSSGDNKYENYPQKEFGLYNERSNVNQSIHQNHPNHQNQPNQYSNFDEKSNINQDYSQRNEQKRFTLNFNDSYQSNGQNSSNFGSIQPNSQNSQNYQNPDTWDNFHRKTLSLKERLYKPSSKSLGFQGYSQENPYENGNNFKTPFQVENAKFRNDQQESFSDFFQTNSLQNGLQDNLLNNTANNINEIEEDPEQRELTIIENLHYIQQAEPVKLEVIHLLMDRNKHPDCQLLREIKRHRYMGSVALGMILYNLIETFGSDMISKKYEEGNDIYYISERFSDLLERTFNV